MTIRRTPEDFTVHERLTDIAANAIAPTFGRATQHAVFSLTKTSLTTPEATSRLAKLLSVGASKVQYAGLKDKHAVTTQFVTVRMDSAGLAARLQTLLDGHGISAKHIGFAPTSASSAWIKCNAFTLVLRDVTPAHSQLLTARARRLTMPTISDHSHSPTITGQADRAAGSDLLIVNYFGEQRFGSARHGAGFAASRLILGDFEGALKLLIGTPARKDTGPRRAMTRLCASHWGDWKVIVEGCPRCPERAAIEALAGGKGFSEAFSALPYMLQEIAVDGFQSLLWNRVAAEVASELAKCETTEGLGQAASTTSEHSWRVTTDYGDDVFVSPRTLSASALETELPLAKPGSVWPTRWQETADRVHSDYQALPSALVIPGLRRPCFSPGNRRLFVRASGFVLGRREKDELGKHGKQSACFELPSGSYATVVLRSLGQ